MKVDAVGGILLGVELAAFVAALAITLLELTEVAALVFALGAEQPSIRAAGYGAAAGTALVGAVTLAVGAVLLAIPTDLLLGAAAVVLAAFGLFLLRSTVRAYRRARGPPGAPHPPAAQFAGGFAVGSVEATEAAIVLLALAAAGFPLEALSGAIVGGALVLGIAALLHDRVRRVKVAPLKLGATALLFTFAIFWGGEALGVAFPLGDFVLLPIFVAIVLLLRGTVELVAPPVATVPVGTNR